MGTPKRSAPAGLDYVPLPGSEPQLSFGVIRATLPGAPPSSAEKAVFRRLYPVRKPDDVQAPWDTPTCARWDVLLPPGASDAFRSPQHLCRSYDGDGYGLKDLVVIVTLRFADIDVPVPLMRLHEVWEMARGFALQRLAKERRLPVIAVLHRPAGAGRPGVPHVHLLALARELWPSGFGAFTKPLATDAGRALMDAEWAAWRDAAREG